MITVTVDVRAINQSINQSMLFIPEYSIHIQIILSHSYAIKKLNKLVGPMHVQHTPPMLAQWGSVYRSLPTMFCRIVLHDLFVDVIKAYILFLISILHVGKPRDTNILALQFLGSRHKNLKTLL